MTTPQPERVDVYVRTRNVTREGLRSEEVADDVTIDYWTDSRGREHVAGVEVLWARGVEVDGVDVRTGRPHGTAPAADGVGAATPAEHEDVPRHEVECPQCGATIRARMADAPDEEGAGVVRLLARCEELDREKTLNRRTHGGGLLPAMLSTAEVRALLSGGEQT